MSNQDNGISPRQTDRWLEPGATNALVIYILYLAGLVIANDIMREDFPRIRPEQSLSDALGAFLGQTVERLPVIENDGRLLGSLSKSDLLLALVEKRQKPTA